MITNDDKLFIKYQKFIEIIISKYKEYIKDDLRQDLLIFLLELLESINIDNIKNSFTEPNDLYVYQINDSYDTTSQLKMKVYSYNREIFNAILFF